MVPSCIKVTVRCFLPTDRHHMTMSLATLLKAVLPCLVIVVVIGKPGEPAGKNECVGKARLNKECDGGKGICFFHHRQPVYDHMVCLAACGQPPSVPNTLPIPTMTQTDPVQFEGAAFTYECDVGSAPRPGDVMDVYCTYHGSWTPATFQCLHDCGSSIPVSSHQIVESTEGHLLGDHANIGCEDHYSATSCITAECTADGWHITGGECVRDCGPPATSVFGNDVLSNPNGDTRVDDVAMYKCQPGLIPKGSLTTICDASGNWVKSDQNAKCIKDCGSIVTGLPDHSSVTCQTGHVEGDTAEATCDDGYVTDAEIQAVCVQQVGWEVTGGPCKRDCGQLSNVPGTYVANALATEQPATTTEGSTAGLDCEEGYKEEENVLITCDAVTGWWIQVPGSGSCLRDCGPVSTVSGEIVANAFATMQPTTTTEGSLADLDCDVGFQEEGEVQLICDAVTGHWIEVSGSGSCLRGCGPVSTMSSYYVANAVVNEQPATTTAGSTAELDCEAGYQKMGTIQVICLDGTFVWTKVDVWGMCLRDCGPASTQSGFYTDNAHLAVQPPTTLENQAAFLECDDGYTMDAEVIIFCSPSGEWTLSPGSGICLSVIKDCGPVSTLSGEIVANAFATMQPTATTEGSLAYLDCDVGFQEEGDLQVQCDAVTGQWTEVPGSGSCIRGCGPVSTMSSYYVANAVANEQPATTTAGSTAELDCEAGYQKMGTIQVICLDETFVWTKVDVWGMCLRDCGPASTQSGVYTDNAYVGVQPPTTLENQAAFLECDDGYTTDAAVIIFCSPSGDWLLSPDSGICSLD